MKDCPSSQRFFETGNGKNMNQRGARTVSPDFGDQGWAGGAVGLDAEPQMRFAATAFALPSINKAKQREHAPPPKAAFLGKKVKPPTAWGDKSSHNSFNPSQEDSVWNSVGQPSISVSSASVSISEKGPQSVERLFQAPAPKKRDKGSKAGRSSSDSSTSGSTLPSNFVALTSHLTRMKMSSSQDEKKTRKQIIHNAESMIADLPLAYVYSKPEFRRYALEKAYRALTLPAVVSLHRILFYAFHRWRTPVMVVMDDRQVGFMVIAKALTSLLDLAIRRKFIFWAICYASRYRKYRGRVPNQAAVVIQKWFRHLQIVQKEPFRRLTHAVQMCLHRRRAIKHTLEFEHYRRQALDKVKKAICFRRRQYFAARSIQRVFRWVKLLRRACWKNIRSIAARRIKAWYRRMLLRDKTDLLIIRLVLRCGGMKLVKPKVPKRYIKTNKGSFLAAVNDTIRQLQRAWFKSCNNFAAFMALSAQRAKEAYEKMLNDMATVIQRSYRAHLWLVLCYAAFINNRARRIQRAFRSCQYRMWVNYSVLRGRHRKVSRIKHAYRKFRWLRLLHQRFVMRRVVLFMAKAKRSMAAWRIQRQYRIFIVHLHQRREELRQLLEQQRKQHGFIIQHTFTIQRFYRQFKTQSKFPHHVLMVCRRIVSERRRLLNKHAFSIQKLGKQYMRRSRAILHEFHTKKVLILWKLTKAYLLKLGLWDRVMATRERKRRASNRIKKCVRYVLWRRYLDIRFLLMREVIKLNKMREHNATFLQMFCRRKLREYNAVLRVAGRRQLHKRRRKEAADAERKRLNDAAAVLQKCFDGNRTWKRNLRKIQKERIFLRRQRSAKKIQRLFKMIVRWGHFWKAVQEKNDRIAAEKLRQKQLAASNVVGRYWKRFKEKSVLNVRFELRKKMLDEYKALHSAREVAYNVRDETLEEMRKTEVSLEATIASSWKQGSDASGRNYYYNYVTGESTWDAPPNWRMKISDQWIKNVDDRLNVYYYNQTTGESRWLPPCCICGNDSMRWCSECAVAYCETDYDHVHGPDAADESFANHMWSLTEYVKDVLLPGEIYCIECKRRAAKRVCTTCWDSYCEECFKFVHHIGALKSHRYISYKKAKKGWMCIKSKVPDEPDYYINGQTGLTTYDKPKELMTDQELIFYENFKTHEAAVQENLKKIDKLQYDLEAVTYDRDTILYDALSGGGGTVSKGKKKSGTGGEKAVDSGADVLLRAQRGNQGFFSNLFSGLTDGYRSQLMHPTQRVRGKERSDYIDNLLAAHTGGDDKDKKKDH